MFMAALFTTARTRKQPKYSSMEKWIKRWYIYTMEYYSTIKKNKIMSSAATWLDLETVRMKMVRERQVSHSITYMWNLKLKQKQHK